MKPVLLDLFSGAGGCARGYQQAGFYVVGVDHKDQPRYAGDQFVKADALAVLDFLLSDNEWQGYVLGDFAAIHASPPCQDRTTLKAVNRHVEDVDYVVPTRQLLLRTGLPYVIENVQGNVSGGSALREPLRLCGSAFGLDVRRHRLFECSFPVMAPGCAHGGQRARFEVYEHGKWRLSATVPVYGAGGQKAREHWATAMGIDWMTHEEMAQAIPPAYTEHIGRYLLAEARRLEEAA